MAKIIFIICSSLFVATWAQALTMSCSFGVYGTAIITTQTEMVNPEKVGDSTLVAYQGTRQKKVGNVMMELKENELFHFQLDEGLADKNIFMIVYKKARQSDSFSAILENPQAQYFKQMQGPCKID